MPTDDFVPDEEAARLLESFLLATAPQLSTGAWPSWTPEPEPAVLVLADGAGAFVRGLDGGAGAGRPVAARHSGTVPGVVYWSAEEAQRAIQAPLGGHPVVLRTVDAPSAAALADAFQREAFRRWLWGRLALHAAPPALPPAEDPRLIAMGHVEGRLMLEALSALTAPEAGQPADWRRLGTAVALIRRERRAALSDAAVEYERWAEVAFGLPAYVGRKCAARLGGPPVGDALRSTLEQLGRAPAEARGAAAGCALAVLLDGLAGDGAAGDGPAADGPAGDGPAADGQPDRWAAEGGAEGQGPGEDGRAPGRHRRHEQAGGEPPQGPGPGRDPAAGGQAAGGQGAGGRVGPGPADDWRLAVGAAEPFDLDRVLDDRVAFDGGPRDDAVIAAAQRRLGFSALLRCEQEAVATARQARQALVDEILRGRGTLLVCDIGRLGAPAVVSARGPEAVNAGVDLYREGGTFRYPGGAVVSARGTPVAHDRRAGLLQLRVPARLAFSGDGEAINPAVAAFREGVALAVGGLRITASQGELRRIDGGFLLRLDR